MQTSPICLVLTGFPNGGLLGQLLCGLANALNNGIPLVEFLGNLPPDQLNTLVGGITDILNGTLPNLYNATLTSIQQVGIHHTCAILHLELGPLNLTLLGLNILSRANHLCPVGAARKKPTQRNATQKRAGVPNWVK